MFWGMASDDADKEPGMPPTFTLSDRLGRRVLIATILASSMAFIDSSALNVALPALQDDLGASGADLLWIVNACVIGI